MTIERHLLPDAPVDTDAFSGGGHDRTALVLAKAIARVTDRDYTIGLDGPWGSGKSTVVEIAKRKLRNENGNKPIRYEVFCFDMWNVQGGSFRRSFLEHFVSWAKTTYPGSKSSLEKIQERIAAKKRKVRNTNRIDLGLYGVCILLMLPLLPFFYAIGVEPVKTAFQKEGIEGMASTWPALLFIAFVLMVLLKGYDNYVSEKDELGESTYWGGVSRALLVATKNFSTSNTDETIKETDPNDFEFHIIFRDVLSHIQDEKNRVLVIIDNIDRLPMKDIPTYWAQARSANSSGPSSERKNNSSIVIIPFDRDYILHAFGELAPDTPRNHMADASNEASLLDDAFISKTFDEVIFVSPPILSSISEFFVLSLTKALPTSVTRETAFRSYLIFAAHHDPSAKTTPPRLIISFINAVSSLYVSHNATIEIPTIALFVCIRRDISKNPLHIIDGRHLPNNIRMIIDNQNVESDLAALSFNVSKELSLQILVDERIKTALTSNNLSQLILLSDSPGFEERLTSVLLATAQDWINSSAFHTVINNLCNVLKNYKGEVSNTVQRAIISCVLKVPAFDLATPEGSAYRRVFDFADRADVPRLLKWLMTATGNRSDFKDIEQEYSAGTSVGIFLGSTLPRYSEGETTDILAAMKGTATKNLGYQYGLAGQSNSFTIPIEPYVHISPELGTDEIVRDVVNLILGHPDSASTAISELVRCKVLSSSDRVVVFGDLISHINGYEPESSEEFVGPYLRALVRLFEQMTREEQGSAPIETLFSTPEIFAAVKLEFDEEPESLVLGDFLFLAAQRYMENGLPVPVTTTGGRSVQQRTDSFTWVDSLHRGEQRVNEITASHIAVLSVRNKMDRRWLEEGSSRPEDELCRYVVHNMFNEQMCPSIDLQEFNDYFPYLQDVYSDDLPALFSAYSQQLARKPKQKIDISLYKKGIILGAYANTPEVWKLALDIVSAQLKEFSAEKWVEVLSSSSSELNALLDMIAGPGIVLGNLSFGTSLTGFISRLFAGEANGSKLGDGVLDVCLEAIHEGYQGELFRVVRESLHNTTPATIREMQRLAPKTLRQIVVFQDELNITSCENIARFILCPSLEDSIRSVLDLFVTLGREKVATIKRRSSTTTKERIKSSWDEFIGRNGGTGEYNERLEQIILGRHRKKGSALGMFSRH